jgi:CHAD domain-containing protein
VSLNSTRRTVAARSRAVSDPPALAPADLAGEAPPGSDAALAEALRSRLGARLAVVQRSLDQVVLDSYPSPERLHRLHADLRRLRVEYRVLSGRFPSALKGHARALDRRLAELARRVGEVRDSDVQLHLLEEAARREGSRSLRFSHEELLRRFADDARTGRELLRAYVRAEHESELLEELGRTIESGRPVGGSLSPRLLERVLDRERDRLARAFRRARRRPSVPRTHRLRIRLRRYRYLLELVGTLPGPPPESYPARLDRLQRDLGRVHDLDLLTDWIDGLPPEVRDAEWARGLRREHREARRELRNDLDRGSVKAAIRGARGA